nr:MAG TPA: hypothetical protein [Caudoviricetes sp.]
MKQYGFNKATEFSKSQISVVYGKAKRGEIKVEKWFISELYNLADYFGYDDNHSVEQSEREVKEILKAVFENDNEEAQMLINETADKWFSLYGKKTQAKCDRTVFVA